MALLTTMSVWGFLDQIRGQHIVSQSLEEALTCLQQVQYMARVRVYITYIQL